jgi:hypothetical protein
MAKSRRAGEWLVKEGEPSGANVYKLLQGKVTVYEGSRKITSIEVNEGEEPKLIGVIAALRSDGGRTASVATDTEIKFETISIDHIQAVMKKEIPQQLKDDIESAIKAITMRDEVNRLLNKISQLSLPKRLEIPENIDPEVTEVLSELKNIYERYT